MATDSSSRKKSASSASREDRRKILIGRFPNNRSAGVPDAQSSKIWSEEIAALSGKRFSSLSDAIECVVEQVGERLHATRDEREFLRLTLSTDPALCSALTRELFIKE